MRGWFTLLNHSGTDVLGPVNGDASDEGFYGRRWQISGSLSFFTRLHVTSVTSTLSLPAAVWFRVAGAA